MIAWKIEVLLISTWRKLERIIFPSSLNGCNNCLKWWWLIRITWESLLLLIVNGWGILKITPSSPNISGDPFFARNCNYSELTSTGGIQSITVHNIWLISVYKLSVKQKICNESVDGNCDWNIFLVFFFNHISWLCMVIWTCLCYSLCIIY